MPEESISEVVDILDNTENVDDWEKKELEVIDKDDKEVKLEEEPKKEEEEIKEPEEIEEDYSPRPSLESINKEFPDLFKKFPQLRDMYFREDKLTKIFPTLEDAQSAREDIEGLEELERGLLSGKTEDITSTLNTIKELGEDVLPNFALNFLPSLQKSDQNAYYSAITPVLVDVVRQLYDAGIRNGNENLKNTGLAAALFLFGDKDVASGSKNVNIPKPKIKEEVDNKDDGRKSLMQERHDYLYNDVGSEYISEIETLIKDGLDPDEVMTPFMRDALVDSIVKRISKVLANDAGHQSQMSDLWKKAESAGFSRDWKDRIKNAALSRAKSIMPTIRNRARAEALSTKEKSGEKIISAGNKEVKKESLRTGATRTVSNPSMSQISRIPRDKIDWDKTSDLDIIQGRVRLK